jgi:hypothetical protein
MVRIYRPLRSASVFGILALTLIIAEPGSGLL